MSGQLRDQTTLPQKKGAPCIHWMGPQPSWCVWKEKSLVPARNRKRSNPILISDIRNGFCLQSLEKRETEQRKIWYVLHGAVPRNSHHIELVAFSSLETFPTSPATPCQPRSDEFIYTGQQQTRYDRLTKWVCYSLREEVVTLWLPHTFNSSESKCFFIQDFPLNF